MLSHQEVRDAAEKAGIDTSGYADYQIQDIIDGATAMSLPGGTIYVPDGPGGENPDPAFRGTQNEINALIAHENEHQAQYQNGNLIDVFTQLIAEAQTNGAAYNTPGTLENKAQQVEDKAIELFKTMDGDQVLEGKTNESKTVFVNCCILVNYQYSFCHFT